MENVRVCENCGARKPDWPPFGPLISLVDNNSTALLQLFKGEFDAVKCQVCGGPLATPSISIGFDQHAEDLVFFGPLAREHPDDLEAIVNDATAEGTVVVADFDSPSALREAAWQRLSPRVAHLCRVLDGLLADTLTDDEWERLWPELTSSAFAAYAIFLQVSLPLFVDAQLAERLRAYPVEQQLRGVQELQARVWCSVCSRWKLSAPPAATLEQDLARYGSEWGIITGAPERFIASFEALDTGTLDPAARYAFEAMQATLCAALGTENPHSEAWAAIYLTVELLRSTSEMEFAKVLDALAISEERARGTVSRQALAVAVGRVAQEDLGPSAGASFDSAAMQAAVNKAGHPDLFGRIYSNGARMQRAGGENLHSDDIALIVGEAVAQYASQPRELEVFLTMMANSVPATLDAEALVGITTSVEDAHGDNPLVRVALRIWLGRILCLRRQPEPFLKRISADPEPWEVDLPLALKAVLWRWRATALRLTGNSARGLGLLASLVEEDERSGRSLPAHLRQNVLGDLAIDYLNVGYHEQALRIQKALLQEPEAGRHPWHLAAVATTYERLGRDEDAVSLLRAALDATTQSQEQKRSELQAQLANVLSRSGDVQEALDLLSGLPQEALSDPTVAVLSAAAWMNLASEPTARARVLSAARGVAELSQSSLARGDTQLHMTATRLFAMIIDRAGVENTRELWELVDSGARAYEGVPDPEALVVLARSDWEQGNLTAGRGRLLELPEALSQRFADTRDVAVALNSLKQLKPVLNALGDQVAHGAGSMADARLVAELQRDVLGRIAARASTDLLSGFVAPNDEEIAHLRWRGQPTCVLELDRCGGWCALAPHPGE